MEIEKYRVCVSWSEPDKAFVAEMPEMPGCMADGKTQEEAIANLRIIASEWIETAQALGRNIPVPGVRTGLQK